MARFGEYELIERIAVGGMAEVYKARVVRPGGVGKTLCIKRVHPKYCADASFRQMFVEEARIGVTLSHGNIVPVFDFGSIDGLYYLAMELVEGRDLAQVAGRARLVGLPFTKDVAVHLVMEVLEGLHYAHERTEEDGRPLHIVHRDVSPSNLIVSRAGEVKILDFGIARAEIREFETRSGVVKGTPGYMAPEQVLGGSPDRRADVYSAGVILWELVNNERYPTDEEGPAPPTGDEELDAILAKAIAMLPDDRYETAREMRDALRDLLLARGLRPGAADLAAQVEAVFAAQADEEDWRFRKSAPADEGMDSEPGSHPAHVPPDAHKEGPESQPPRTEAITRPGERRRRILLVLAGLVAIAGVAAAAVVVPGGDGPPRTSRPEPVRTGSLVVKTDPPGATVEVDGDAVGESPATVRDLEAGDHVVRVHLEGHRDVERTAVVRAGRERSLDLVLLATTGRLHIETRPPGALIEVDGREVGTSPIESLELPPGEYRIRATIQGRPPQEREERVDADRSLRIEIEIPPAVVPPPVPALLSVNTSDAWGKVFLDGREIGNTPIREHVVARPGRHVLVVTNPSRPEWRRVLSLRPGERKVVVVEW